MVLVGTYTSIFIAAPILIYLGVGTGRDAPDQPRTGTNRKPMARRLCRCAAIYRRPAPIDAYGNGGFRFGGMSHRGSLLCFPDGMWAWPVTSVADLTEASLRAGFCPCRRDRCRS